MVPPKGPEKGPAPGATNKRHPGLVVPRGLYRQGAPQSLQH